MIRRTKIVATLGPATDEPKIIDELILAGVDMVRLNFSHGLPEDHMKRARMVRESAARQGKHVAIMGDLQGPKIRIDRFKDGPIVLEDGAPFILDAALGKEDGNQERVGLTYKQLVDDVREGDTLLLDDGRIVFTVVKIVGAEIHCTTLVGGTLSNNKGINRQGGGLSAPAITAKDRADIKTAAEIGVDYIAVSFPRSAADMHEARDLLRAAGCDAGLVAKIERAEAVVAIDEIIEASDVIMIARGDLGVEIGDAELPAAQKLFIRKARLAKRAVITATQMMETMISNPIPTRAEVFDVANAVLDGTDAVMLSGETAAGKFPIKVVQAMAHICARAESQIQSKMHIPPVDLRFERVDETIALSAMYAANHMSVSAIIALTESGSTALWMSRVNSMIPIYALTRREATARRVAVYRGVVPIFFHYDTTDHAEVNRMAIHALSKVKDLHNDDLVIITKGDLVGKMGGTNAMKIMRVGDGFLPGTE